MVCVSGTAGNKFAGGSGPEASTAAISRGISSSGSIFSALFTLSSPMDMDDAQRLRVPGTSRVLPTSPEYWGEAGKNDGPATGSGSTAVDALLEGICAGMLGVPDGLRGGSSRGGDLPDGLSSTSVPVRSISFISSVILGIASFGSPFVQEWSADWLILFILWGKRCQRD
jgi:hypothetical protein